MTAAETAFALRPKQDVRLQIQAPALWFPWTHGDPAVYTLRLEDGSEAKCHVRVNRMSEEAEEMVEELIDRFSDPPESVLNLIRIAKLKAKAHQVFLTEVTEKQGRIEFVFYERAPVDPTKIPAFVDRYDGALTFRADKKAPYFVYEAKNNRDARKEVLDFCEEFLPEMGDYLLDQGL